MTNSNEAMATARVCRGRTVLVSDPDRRISAGFREDGSPITKPFERPVGPGDVVTLPAHEIEHLKQTGYVQDLADPTPTGAAHPHLGSQVGMVASGPR